MAVDKSLIIKLDLENLTEDDLQKVDKAIEKGKKQSKKNKKQTEKDKTKIKDIDTKEIIDEFPIEDVLAGGSLQFFVRQFSSALPIIGPLLVASSFFIDFLLKLDALQKKFVDIADTRISVFVDRQQQAQIDNNLQQIIYTTTAGGTHPRDSYNTFDSYDRQLRDDGINRDSINLGAID